MLSFYGALGADVAIWTGWSTLVGVWATRWSDRSVGRDGRLTRLRSWERNGQVYAHLGIRRWKGRLPDLGRLFGGRRLVLGARRDPDEWTAMAAETRRAERVHWLIPLALPIEAVLHTGALIAAMAVFAAATNLPCIATQRYNRGRLVALRRRHGARATSTAAARTGVATGPAGGAPHRADQTRR